MGLLTDTFDLYKKQLEKLQGINNTGDDFSGMDSDFNSSGAGIKASLQERKSGSPLINNNINTIPKQDAKPSDPIVMGGLGTQQADDMGFMQKLANMANVDFDKAAATWKDKGGFEGLMSNPAFTIAVSYTHLTLPTKA